MSIAPGTPRAALKMGYRALQQIARRSAVKRSSIQAQISSSSTSCSPSTSALRSWQAPSAYGSRFISPASISNAAVSKRSFFSLPDISKLAKLAGSAAEAVSSASGGGEGQVQTDGDRQTYHARKILPYSQEQLYSLVADIPSYSSFIPFCSSSVVLASESSHTPSTSRSVDTNWKPPATRSENFDVDAELKVGFGGFDEAYISRVKGRPFESVSATAGEASLFKSLRTTWSFAPASSLSPHPSTTIPSPSSDSSSHTSQSSPPSDTTRGPTLLTIDLAFEFTNPLHRIASQAVLPKVADKMVEAFEKRCLEVYGKGRD